MAHEVIPLVQESDTPHDHLGCRAHSPELALTYDNLIYACHACNLTKGSSIIPDPNVHAFGACLRVEDSGAITALNDEGEILIDEFDFDAGSRIEWRVMIIQIIQTIAKSGDTELLRSLMGLPTHLPDLSSLRPPDGNIRTEGLANSWLRRRVEGREPLIFES